MLFFRPLFSGLLFSAICFFYHQNIDCSWITPQRISSTVSDQVDISLDSEGNAQAIWQGSDGLNYNIQTSSLPFGGSWTTPIVLSNAGEDAQGPNIGIDISGNATSLWSRFDGNNSVIQSAFMPAGESWSGPSNVSAAGFNADSSQLSSNLTNSLGTVVAVWHRFNGSNFIVQSSTATNGSWSVPTNISPSGQDALIPQIALDHNGNAIAACARFDGTSFTSRSAMMLQGQAWSPSYILSDPGQTASAASTAVDSSGNGILVWSQFIGSKYTIQVSTYLYGGSWSNPGTISSSDSGDAYIPLVVLDSSGNATSVWIQHIGSYFMALASTKPVGGSWSVPVNLSNASVNVTNVSLTVDPSGNVSALWDETDGVNSVIQYASLPFNGTWSSISTVSESGNYAYLPSVGTDLNGNLVAIWLQSNGLTNYVWGSTHLFGS